MIKKNIKNIEAEIQLWLKNITLAWVFLGGLEAFLSFVTDHFHQQPVARQSTNPPSKSFGPNVKMLIILWPVFEPCKCVTCLSVVAFKTFEDPLQGGRVWLKDPDAVWKPAEVTVFFFWISAFCLFVMQVNIFKIKGGHRLQREECGGWRRGGRPTDNRCQRWASWPAPSEVNN